MIRTKVDSKQINRILENTVSYSYGFLDGIDMDQILLNERIGDFVVDALNKYIDSQARMSPESLHHVYEWNQVGNADARLFKITSKASKRVITFDGKFLASRSVSDNATVPFTNKAEIMENGISVTIEPNDGVLAFEDDGEMVFTASSIYIAHPGGDEVAGSFGRVIEDFFSNYLTKGLLLPFLQKLGYPIEYSQNFPAGTKGGRNVGISTGKKYLKSAGAEIA